MAILEGRVTDERPTGVLVERTESIDRDVEENGQVVVREWTDIQERPFL